MGTGKGSDVALRAIDLFCGAGGLTEGLRSVGFDVSFALDVDRDSCESYRANHPHVDVEHRSVTEITPAEIALRAGDVDVIVGGPSCQGFSTAGRRTEWVREDDPRNQLWSQMLDIVAELRPRAFLMENVPGLVYWKDGSFGDKVLAAFRDLGYAVTYQILLAADYGVPQRRRRLFIVGMLGDTPFEFPAPSHLGGWRRDTLDLWEAKRREQRLHRHLNCWSAIGDLPPLGDGAGVHVGSYPSSSRPTPYIRKMRQGSEALRDHEVQPLGVADLAMVRHVPAGGTWRDIPPHLLPDRYRGMRRTDSTNLLGRLDPALPAYTITTQFTNVTTGCFTHPYEDRSLSLREGARLQSFPDRYQFSGSFTSRARQIGNAVPPMLAAVLAASLAQQLGSTAHVRPKSVRPAKELPPPPTDGRTRKRMRSQQRVDTRPEVALRSALYKLGLRPRKDRAVAALGPRYRIDVVFPTEKVAVFVDGCFWHGCAVHSRSTKSNTRWWAEKIATNKTRDAEVNRLLADDGWLVIRVWEHEDPVDAATRVDAAVRSRRRQPEDRAS